MKKSFIYIFMFRFLVLPSSYWKALFVVAKIESKVREVPQDKVVTNVATEAMVANREDMVVNKVATNKVVTNREVTNKEVNQVAMASSQEATNHKEVTEARFSHRWNPTLWTYISF